jgi:hypothetical protein
VIGELATHAGEVAKLAYELELTDGAGGAVEGFAPDGKVAARAAHQRASRTCAPRVGVWRVRGRARAVTRCDAQRRRRVLSAAAASRARAPRCALAGPADDADSGALGAPAITTAGKQNISRKIRARVSVPAVFTSLIKHRYANTIYSFYTSRRVRKYYITIHGL